jgi:hypothetical protein
MICSRDNWDRRRTTDFTFHATVEEMYEFFLDIFANKRHQLDINDFYICCQEWIRGEDRLSDRKRHISSFDFNQFIDCLHSRDAINFYIGNENITQRNEIIRFDYGTWLMSGLINFKHDSKMIKDISPSRLTMNTVVDNKAGETYEHTEYHRIYKIFKREFRKRLPYKTYHHGGQHIDNQCFMSEGIVERWKSGIVYSHDPVLD